MSYITLAAPTAGGTGVNNGTNTLTLAGTLATSGAFASTFTMTGPTSVTFPTSGTLATTAGVVTSVSGTTNRVTSTGGSTPVIDISASYVGQSSITTLGTITTGVWNGTAIANANLANSSLTVNGTLISLGASGTVTAAAGTLTGTTLNATVVTSSLTSVGTLTGLNVQGGNIRKRTAVTNAMTPYTVLSTDYILAVNTSGGIVTTTLPGASTAGTIYIVKDENGTAATSNITITPASGNIDGASSLVINTNYTSFTLYSDGTNYHVI